MSEEVLSAPAETAGDGGEAASRTPASEYAANLQATQPFRNYEIRQCLASGPASAVFKAKDLGMERTVALKVMRPGQVRAGAVEDFFSLAGSIARLRTASAARAYDAGRVGADFFMAYAYVSGESLAERLARRQTRMTEKESLRLAALMADALNGLFAEGHPHGNFRPSNIMLVEGGKAVLADVGFAWNLAWPTDDEAFAARPDHLPPERIRGDLNIDIRGDLYAMGTIWYRALLGEPVFKGRDGHDILRQHLEAKPVPPRELDPRLTAATSSLIMWLLEKDRDARPRTPREFIRKLASHPLATAGGEAAKAQAAPAVEAVPEPIPDADAPPVESAGQVLSEQTAPEQAADATEQ